MGIDLVLTVVALVMFFLAFINIPVPRVNLVAGGLFFALLTVVV